MKPALTQPDVQLLVETIRDSVIGDGVCFRTAFGLKPLVYADYTASGRALGFIEDFIRERVLPFYANTHSETSFTGAQTMALREEAREEIRRAVNAGPEDRVIFCGSGATAAIDKLIGILNLRIPANLDDDYRLAQRIPPHSRPVVFLGPYEHHSNELPWRESIADTVTIPLDGDGRIDLRALEDSLCTYSDRPLKIGSFSAASNVTGVRTDIDAVAALLHRYGALSFWDYAAAGPYVDIDMQGKAVDYGDTTRDAAFISPHKFVGGPGTPGVLVAKARLLRNRVPAVPGGGTVMYVTPEDHRYVADAERREEGGTPGIVEAIRAGLVFKLKRCVGSEEIERREQDFVQRALERWARCPAIQILGNPQLPRLSIFSFQLLHRGKMLHYNFVVALLNDLFGIQSRGGCSCAGPYGHALLGIDMDLSRALERQIVAGHRILRPGWVRLNFNYFIDEATFEYLLRAVELVAEHGWRLLPYYRFDPQASVWRYQDLATPMLASLADIDFSSMQRNAPQQPRATAPSLRECLQFAEQELRRPLRSGVRYRLELPPEAEHLRWFVSPQEIVPEA